MSQTVSSPVSQFPQLLRRYGGEVMYSTVLNSTDYILLFNVDQTIEDILSIQGVELLCKAFACLHYKVTNRSSKNFVFTVRDNQHT